MTKKMNEYDEYDVIAGLYGGIDERLSRLPLRIPVVLQNIEIGNIKIDVEYNKEQKIPKDGDQEFDFFHTFLVILNELYDIAPLIKKDIELIAQMEAKYEGKKRRLQDLMFFLHPGSLAILDWPWGFFYMKEEEIFDLVKTEGPIALRNSLVQERINNWLSDKDLSGVKMNKLKDSLLEYAFGYSPKDILFKTGRPRKSLLEILKPERVINTYHTISALLKIAKRNKERYKGNIRVFIRKAGKEFLQSKKDDPKWQSTYKRSIKDKEFDFFFIVWSCIESNTDLTNAFKSFLWQPGNFAKVVLARLLDVSESTMAKYISNNQSSS